MMFNVFIALDIISMVKSCFSIKQMQLIFTFLLNNHAPILDHNRPECSLGNDILNYGKPHKSKSSYRR